MTNALSDKPTDDLKPFLEAIKGDPAEQASEIRSRTESFLGAENVSMMGGWT